MIRHSEYDCHDGEENQRYTKEVMVERVRDIKSGENMLVQGSRKLQATIFFFTNKTLLELNSHVHLFTYCLWLLITLQWQN